MNSDVTFLSTKEYSCFRMKEQSTHLGNYLSLRLYQKQLKIQTGEYQQDIN